MRLDIHPGFVQPHQPRLDWQLWFAGLLYERILKLFWQINGREPESYAEINRFIYQRYRHVYVRHFWVHNLIKGILNRNPAILNLIDLADFQDRSFYFRAWLFDYHFTEYGDSSWWRRDNKRMLFPKLNGNTF